MLLAACVVFGEETAIVGVAGEAAGAAAAVAGAAVGAFIRLGDGDAALLFAYDETLGSLLCLEDGLTWAEEEMGVGEVVDAGTKKEVEVLGEEEEAAEEAD